MPVYKFQIFIDESFSKCAANIVNGDMFLIQRIISLVMCNATEIKSPKRSFKQTPNLLLREQDEDYDIDDKKKNAVFKKYKHRTAAGF